VILRAGKLPLLALSGFPEHLGYDFAGEVESVGRAHLVVVRSRARDLAVIAQLVEQGKLRPIVHDMFTLEQAAQAQLQVESKHSRGKVVISI
jgi:NADPH:quinone reductase-like Zn-dependent oxidoreductase